MVADGGELVLYAPHIRDFSEVHGDLLGRVGYHTRDYFTGQWERFAHLPGGILAHSTAPARREAPGTPRPASTRRIRVTLATAISPERCAEHNLGYLDPVSVDPQEWAKDKDTLVVPKAGEVLHRLRR